MGKKNYSPENPCTNELQWSIFDSTDQKLTSNIFDCNGKEIEIGHTLSLTFNPDDKFHRYSSIFKVIWKDAGYKIKSEYGKESYLGSISHNVKVEVLDD